MICWAKEFFVVGSCLCLVECLASQTLTPSCNPQNKHLQILPNVPYRTKYLVENHCFSQKNVTISFEVLVVQVALLMTEAELGTKPPQRKTRKIPPLLPCQTLVQILAVLHKCPAFLYFSEILGGLGVFLSCLIFCILTRVYTSYELKG